MLTVNAFDAVGKANYEFLVTVRTTGAPMLRVAKAQLPSTQDFTSGCDSNLIIYYYVAFKYLPVLVIYTGRANLRSENGSADKGIVYRIVYEKRLGRGRQSRRY
jgi:hypothetical protein